MDASRTPGGNATASNNSSNGRRSSPPPPHPPPSFASPPPAGGAARHTTPWSGRASPTNRASSPYTPYSTTTATTAPATATPGTANSSAAAAAAAAAAASSTPYSHAQSAQPSPYPTTAGRTPSPSYHQQTFFSPQEGSVSSHGSASTGGFMSPSPTAGSASHVMRQRRQFAVDNSTMSTPGVSGVDMGPPTSKRLFTTGTSRQQHYADTIGGASGGPTPLKRRVVRNLDLFPKVDRDMVVTTDHGGVVTLVGYAVIVVLVLAEVLTHMVHNATGHTEHLVVDTSLNKKMEINLNITFPALSCDDVHVDAMDVAGDSQLDVEDTLVKYRLHLDGTRMDEEELRVVANRAKEKDEERKRLIKESLDPGYCGPCYGADPPTTTTTTTTTTKPPDGKEGEEGEKTEGEQDANKDEKAKEDEKMEHHDDDHWHYDDVWHHDDDYHGGDKDEKERKLKSPAGCCNTCDDLKAAYEAKRWKIDGLMKVAEQCVREGREALNVKRMTKGEGCNLSGYMLVNKVAGNFHIAMGEGVERDGRHIHQFIPEDAPNFNATHIIHELAFGPNIKGQEKSGGLDGVTKVTTSENGVTGLFQYFLKIVPTIYRNEKTSSSEETNRFFYTERYRPLMTDLHDEHHELGSESQHEVKGAVAGGKTGGSHGHQDHHRMQNAVLPGVFFMYEMYPFAVEVSKTYLPLTHLLIRLMAAIGGVITITGWVDAVVYARDQGKSKVRPYNM